MHPDTPYTLPFHSSDTSLARVGGKGASLSRLAQAGFPIPPGFHVTTDAYRRFVDANQLQARILDLARVSADDPTGLERASAAIRDLFYAAPIPPDIADAISAAYSALADRRPQTADGGRPPASHTSSLTSQSSILNLQSSAFFPVAVRSSATAEDLPDASFAGQQDTYLNIEGTANVLDAVRRCWASLWTARAMGYRARNEIAPDSVSLAVVVQTLVPAEAAGILFTANPVTGHRGQAVIDGSWGLGEAVVGGLVTPDHWVVDKASGRIVSADIRDKTVMTVRTARGTEEVPTPEEKRLTPVLSETQVVDLTRLASQIETYYGTPQDIEWVLADGRLFIVQSRPITSLFPQPSPAPPSSELHIYLNANSVQGMLEPFTPAGLSAFRDVARGIGQVTGANAVADNKPGILNFVAGRIFVDMSTPLRSQRASRFLRGFLSLADPQMGAIIKTLQTDPRFAPQPDGPLFKTLQRYHFVSGLARTVLPRLIGLWLAPDKQRRRLLDDHNTAIADLHQRVEAARTLQERLAIHDDLSRIIRQRAPRLLPMVISGLIPQRLSEALVSRWLGDQTAVLELLRGVPHNPTTTMDLSLWEWSRRVADDPVAAAALRQPTPEVVAGYRAGTLPTTLQAALGSFLAIYGHRAIREIDLGMPRWSEEPGYIIDVMRTYLDIQDPDLAPDTVFRRGEAVAEAGTRALLDCVAQTRLGWLRRLVLSVLLNRMRALAGLREFPKFTFVRIFAEYRRLWWQMGHDLTQAGVLDDPADVFFVTSDEIRAVTHGQTEPLGPRVAERRATYQTELRRRRVPRLITNEGLEFYTGVMTEDGAKTLGGTGASPGVVEGVARVILDPHNALLQPGEILVAPSTDPAWTPLFLAAGGLVMEAGGVMSHGSVVAREYGIPAVVGVADATQILRTGQRVTVDGTQGRVIIND